MLTVYKKSKNSKSTEVLDKYKCNNCTWLSGSSRVYFSAAGERKTESLLWEAPGEPVKPFPKALNPPFSPDKLRLAALPVVTGAIGCRSVCLSVCYSVNNVVRPRSPRWLRFKVQTENGYVFLLCSSEEMCSAKTWHNTELETSLGHDFASGSI